MDKSLLNIGLIGVGRIGKVHAEHLAYRIPRARLAAVYGNGPDGKIARAPEGSRGQGHYVDGPRKSFAGGAGLLSTAHDYARFLEMIRRGGELDGVRILSPRTVALMTTNQVGDLYRTPGLGFGLARPGFTAGSSLSVTMDEQARAAGAIAAVNGINVVFAPAFVLLYEQVAPLPFLIAAAILAGLLVYTFTNPTLRNLTDGKAGKEEAAIAGIERADEGV